MTEKRKYRGLTKDGKWVHGWYIEMPGKQKTQIRDEGSGAVSCKLEDAETISCIAYKSKTQVALDFRKVLPETVGQSTGLKDKNGVEIYAGDKIDVHPEPEFKSCRKYIRTVEWNEEFAQFQALFKDGSGQLFTKWQCLAYEVIGNIHQNPELLENR